jgi:hypothetical protein
MKLGASSATIGCRGGVMEDDVILIYASTHGSPKELDVAGQNFLILHDTNVDNLFSTAIELEDLARTIRTAHPV